MTGAALQGAQQSGMGCGWRLLFDQPPAGQDHRPHVQKHSVPEAHTTEDASTSGTIPKVQR